MAQRRVCRELVTGSGVDHIYADLDFPFLPTSRDAHSGSALDQDGIARVVTLHHVMTKVIEGGVFGRAGGARSRNGPGDRLCGGHMTVLAGAKPFI